MNTPEVNPIFMLPEIQEIASDMTTAIVSYSTNECSTRSLVNEFIGRIVQAVESDLTAKIITKELNADWLKETHNGACKIGHGLEIAFEGTTDSLRGLQALREYQRGIE